MKQSGHYVLTAYVILVRGDYMELWDVYNRDKTKSDKTMVRGEKFEKDAYHLVVHACIFNSQGEMLIQQRQPFKSEWPNMWDITVGGSAVSGETSQTAIERELFECAQIGAELDQRMETIHQKVENAQFKKKEA